jgi:hypothetical protein
MEDGDTVSIIAVLKNIKKAIYCEIGFDQDLAKPFSSALINASRIHCVQE